MSSPPSPSCPGAPRGLGGPRRSASAQRFSLRRRPGPDSPRSPPPRASTTPAGVAAVGTRITRKRSRSECRPRPAALGPTSPSSPKQSLRFTLRRVAEGSMHSRSSGPPVGSAASWSIKKTAATSTGAVVPPAAEGGGRLGDDHRDDPHRGAEEMRGGRPSKRHCGVPPHSAPPAGPLAAASTDPGAATVPEPLVQASPPTAAAAERPSGTRKRRRRRRAGPSSQPPASSPSVGVPSAPSDAGAAAACPAPEPLPRTSPLAATGSSSPKRRRLGGPASATERPPPHPGPEPSAAGGCIGPPLATPRRPASAYGTPAGARPQRPASAWCLACRRHGVPRPRHRDCPHRGCYDCWTCRPDSRRLLREHGVDRLCAVVLQRLDDVPDDGHRGGRSAAPRTPGTQRRLDVDADVDAEVEEAAQTQRDDEELVVAQRSAPGSPALAGQSPLPPLDPLHQAVSADADGDLEAVAGTAARAALDLLASPRGPSEAPPSPTTPVSRKAPQLLASPEPRVLGPVKVRRRSREHDPPYLAWACVPRILAKAAAKPGGRAWRSARAADTAPRVYNVYRSEAARAALSPRDSLAALFRKVPSSTGLSAAKAPREAAAKVRGAARAEKVLARRLAVFTFSDSGEDENAGVLQAVQLCRCQRCYVHGRGLVVSRHPPERCPHRHCACAKCADVAEATARRSSSRTGLRSLRGAASSGGAASPRTRPHDVPVAAPRSPRSPTLPVDGTTPPPRDMRGSERREPAAAAAVSTSRADSPIVSPSRTDSPIVSPSRTDSPAVSTCRADSPTDGPPVSTFRADSPADSHPAVSTYQADHPAVSTSRADSPADSPADTDAPPTGAVEVGSVGSTAVDESSAEAGTAGAGAAAPGGVGAVGSPSLPDDVRPPSAEHEHGGRVAEGDTAAPAVFYLDDVEDDFVLTGFDLSDSSESAEFAAPIVIKVEADVDDPAENDNPDLADASEAAAEVDSFLESFGDSFDGGLRAAAAAGPDVTGACVAADGPSSADEEVSGTAKDCMVAFMCEDDDAMDTAAPFQCAWCGREFFCEEDAEEHAVRHAEDEDADEDVVSVKQEEVDLGEWECGEDQPVECEDTSRWLTAMSLSSPAATASQPAQPDAVAPAPGAAVPEECASADAATAAPAAPVESLGAPSVATPTTPTVSAASPSGLSSSGSSPIASSKTERSPCKSPPSKQSPPRPPPTEHAPPKQLRSSPSPPNLSPAVAAAVHGAHPVCASSPGTKGTTAASAAGVGAAAQPAAAAARPAGGKQSAVAVISPAALLSLMTLYTDRRPGAAAPPQTPPMTTPAGVPRAAQPMALKPRAPPLAKNSSLLKTIAHKKLAAMQQQQSAPSAASGVAPVIGRQLLATRKPLIFRRTDGGFELVAGSPVETKMNAPVGAALQPKKLSGDLPLVSTRRPLVLKRTAAGFKLVVGSPPETSGIVPGGVVLGPQKRPSDVLGPQKRPGAGPGFPCTACPMKLNSLVEQAMHRLTRHSAETWHRCPRCPETFHSAERRDAHANTAHALPRRACPQCPERAPTPLLLAAHRLDKHGVPAALACPVCGAAADSVDGLTAHLRGRHADVRQPLQCNACDFGSHDVRALLAHVSLHVSRLRDLHCCRCAAWFPTIRLLQAHALDEHAAPVAYVCPVCAEGVASKKKLQAHLRLHGDPRPFSCVCGVRLAKFDDLLRHAKDSLHFVEACSGGLPDSGRDIEKMEAEMNLLPLERVAQLLALIGDVQMLKRKGLLPV
ncbi:hypothetical protein ONE63_003571 [Megalurothrips usitatus]|uniref:Serine-rich adhesin for platelets-like n=1 Tax=Megalurothrips usitatus TaxID=439358 RepID=A0AAV7XAC5_9NEOP|nr:hypothetical protein ONE63_003571 [Megalurothrips usitatus]